MMMVDSGAQISNGPVDHYDVYKRMVDTALIRPPEAEIQGSWWRSGNKVEFIVKATNLRPDTLTEVYIMGIVYEENRIKLTNRFARVVADDYGNDMLPYETRYFHFTIEDDLVGVDWNKLQAIVLIEHFRKDWDHFDMLQAAPAQRVEPSLSVAPESLAFMIDAGDVAGPTATVQVLGGGFAAWTAASNQPWLAIAPAAGNLLDRPQVTIDKDALGPGWQEGTVTFRATDAGFTDTVAVRAYLGEVERIYMPVAIR